MPFSRGCRIALYLSWVWLGGCRACSSKTPVPFKRAVDAGTKVAASEERPAEEPGEAATSYPEGTQKILVSGTTIERRAGHIWASVAHDLNEDQKPEVLIISSDDDAHAALEIMAQGSDRASARVLLGPEPVARGCRPVAAKLGLLGAELGLASIDFLCDASSTPPLGPSPTEPASPVEAPPPEPDEQSAQTQHFVFSLAMSPRIYLRVCADWPAEGGEPVSPDLQIAGADIDGDQHEDVTVSLTPSDDSAEATPITLTWLSRTTGLARERKQPEESLAAMSAQATKLLAKKTRDAAKLAARAVELHRLLCKEAGTARLWVDDVRGVPCGPSNGAGKALATVAIAQARQQALLPALEARAAMDASGYAVDRVMREQVAQAIGAIRGDTAYRWTMGPPLAAASAPNLRLPALGFIDDDRLLLRGPVAQSYEVQARVATPTGMSGSALASDSAQRFVLTDIVRGCDGYRVRIVPVGGVVGGVVTGAVSSEPLLQPEAAGPENPACSGRPRSEAGGYTLLGMSTTGAVFAHGKHLWLLPLDGRGEAAGPAREVAPNQFLPPLQSPGALDPSARYLALATSEGVALIDRAQDSARLVRSPASCAGGRVSDAVISPSGKKLAMLCAGRLYVAEPAAESGTVDRPISEHP
jgi:hypothetical protein